MFFQSKKDYVFLLLAGFFITNAVVGELIGGKLIQLGPFTMSIGIIPWPIVFLTTDLLNEYYGKKGVRRLTLLTVGLIIYTFIVILASSLIKSSPVSPVSDEIFKIVFGQSMWIIVGSITAFLISQLLDVFVFWLLRSRTGHKHIWLRSTGSTVVSQLIDSFIITGIAFWLPGMLSFTEFVNLALTGYVVKLAIAVLLTPLIYAVHGIIDRYLGDEESKKLIEQTAKVSLSETKEVK